MILRFFNKFLLPFFLLPLLPKSASALLPTPDHVVVLVLENHAYFQIVGSPAAPYINGLIADPMCALFTQSFGLTHPSQPNYINMFSGSSQGVTNNNAPPGAPFTTPNLGAELIAAGETFTGYSQNLPFTGFLGEVAGAYGRKHSPWTHWQGSGTNGVPASCNQPFTAFPTNYDLLPTVSFVIPDMNYDMHNGSDPGRIATGDLWVQDNLNGYIQWAKTHNSLFILTFDEDNDHFNNQITTLFLGPMVQHGNYSNYIDHFSLLRTIEDMYGCTHAGAAASAQPIDFVWNICGTAPVISAGGPTVFCSGDNVTLNCPPATSYLWSNGETTQNINAYTTDNYYVQVPGSNGCPVTSNSITVNANFDPVINTISPSGSPIGGLITIDGVYLSGTTQVLFNGINATYSINSDNQIITTVPNAATSGPITITNNCGTTVTTTPFSIINSTINLTVKLFIEGYYTGGGQMKSILGAGACDSVTLELHEDEDPYDLFYSTTSVINTAGIVHFDVTGAAFGQPLYIVVNSRNSLKTWSWAPITFGMNTSFDFTTSASKAFGNNMKDVGNGKFAIYSGDLNQDDKINLSDLNEMRLNLNYFITGYHRDDLTGDNFVESTDFSLLENNIVPIVVVHP